MENKNNIFNEFDIEVSELEFIDVMPSTAASRAGIYPLSTSTCGSSSSSTCSSSCS